MRTSLHKDGHLYHIHVTDPKVTSPEEQSQAQSGAKEKAETERSEKGKTNVASSFHQCGKLVVSSIHHIFMPCMLSGTVSLCLTLSLKCHGLVLVRSAQI